MKIKNPIRAGIVLLALALGLTACGGSASSTASSAASSEPASSVSESKSVAESVPESTSTAPEASSSASEETSSAPEETNAEPSALDGITFTVSKVRNDVTGNWRISCIAENIDMSEHALDYYKQYFTDDSEIHFIVNFNNNTTTKIMNMSGLLDVTVQDYVSKEEHDANVLGSGTLLAEYFVDKETGEIEKIQ